MNAVMLRLAAAGLLLAGAVPALAQPAPPPLPPTTPPMQDRPGPNGPGGYARGDHLAGRGFASLSEQGRSIMREALRSGGDRKADREAVKAARDRILAVLDADRLDTAALKRAMEDERNIVNASRDRTQSAMQAAFARLSVTDRKAFVADARALKDRMETRVQRWRDMRGRRGAPGRHGPDGPDGGPDAPIPPAGF